MKELKLASIRFPNNDKNWLQTIAPKFVCLEILDLYSLHDANKGAIRISNPSQRTLVFKNCVDFNHDSVIDAPNLRSVMFMNNRYPFYSLPYSKTLSQVCFSSCRAKQPVNALWLNTFTELFAETNHTKDMSMTIIYRKTLQVYTLSYIIIVI